jgi:hypothetical protein
MTGFEVLKSLLIIFHLEVLTAIMQPRLDADNVTKGKIKNCSRKLKCQIKALWRSLYFVQSDVDCQVSSSKTKIFYRLIRSICVLKYDKFFEK